MDTHYIRLSGKVNIPEPLEIGRDWHIAILGSIIGRNEDDNHDGSHSIIWKFEPLTIEILKPTGQTIKADKRRQSQKLRMALLKKWETSNESVDFDDYYINETNKFIRQVNGEE